MSKSLPVQPKNEIRYINIGLAIKHYRRAMGLTQFEFAAKCGLSRTYISAIEARNVLKVISLEALFVIADNLEVAPSQLLAYQPPT